MSKPTYQPAQHITPELLKTIQETVTTHYVSIINPDELKVDNNWYSLIINSPIGETFNGAKYYNSLDTVIGTANAKALTESILNQVRATFTTIDLSY